SGGAAARGLHRRRGAVDPEHGALRSHEPGGKQRYVAHPAADIEDRHAFAQPGATEDIDRELLEQRSLLRQASLLQLGVAERVILCTAHRASGGLRAMYRRDHRATKPRGRQRWKTVRQPSLIRDDAARDGHLMYCTATRERGD